jgi:UbiD family decarboxylase
MRSFVELLEEMHPEEVVRVSKGPLRPAEGECVALMYHLVRQGKWPMVIFDHVTTLAGQRWPGSLAFGVAGTWSKVAIGYDLPPDEQTPLGIEDETIRRVKNPRKPLVIPTSQAPVKARVYQEGETTWFDLPAYRAHARDARPGWVTGPIVVKDPDTGRYNLSWHREHVLAPERATCRIATMHLWDIIQKHNERGDEWVPFIQVFGHHVLFGLAAAMRCGLDVDEYDFASGILGEPLRLTASQTWGEDFLIPADAEAVLEGYISTRERDHLGPWVEFMRYYSPQSKELVARITALNMREDPIFEGTWVGQYVYSDVAHSSFLRQMLLSRFAGVGAINYVAPFTAIIQFKPQRPGDVRRLVGMAHAYGEYLNHIIVVDEDVDPFDLHQVFWSIGTRVDASKQVYVVDDLSVIWDEPMAKEIVTPELAKGLGGPVIDSTKPVGQCFDEVGYPAPEVLGRIRLQDYVPPEKIEQLLTGKTTRPWAMK